MLADSRQTTAGTYEIPIKSGSLEKGTATSVDQTRSPSPCLMARMLQRASLRADHSASRSAAERANAKEELPWAAEMDLTSVAFSLTWTRRPDCVVSRKHGLGESV